MLFEQCNAPGASLDSLSFLHFSRSYNNRFPACLAHLASPAERQSHARVSYRQRNTSLDPRRMPVYPRRDPVSDEPSAVALFCRRRRHVNGCSSDGGGVRQRWQRGEQAAAIE